MVECNLAKVEVEGSNPFSRSTSPLFCFKFIFQAPSPSGKAEVCKTFIGGSSPPGASIYFYKNLSAFAICILEKGWLGFVVTKTMVL